MSDAGGVVFARAPVVHALHDLINWLLCDGSLWPDEVMRLHKIRDHFDGKQIDRDEFSEQKVRVKLRKHDKRIKRRYLTLAQQKIRKKWTQLLIKRPSAQKVETYGRCVVFLLSCQSDRGVSVPDDVVKKLDQFVEDLDVMAVTLHFGGHVG